jgi:copper resistance protein C
VSALGPAGPCQIGYRGVSDDGHPVEGTVSFTLTTPGAAAAAPQTAEPAPVTAPAVDPQAATQQSEGARSGRGSWARASSSRPARPARRARCGWGG